MSGSLNQVGGNAVQAIQGNPPATAPYNPLAVASQWQDYQNKLQANALMKQQTSNAQLENQTGQQSLATTMAKRHNQIMFGLATLPDSQLPAAAQAALNDEIKTGQLDPQRAAVMQQRLTENMNNPSALRATITSGLISNMAGPEAIKALTPQITNTDIGGQMVPQVAPSPIALATGTTPSLTLAPGTLNRTQPPGYQNTGGQLVPVGGSAGAPTLNTTLTPDQSTGMVDQLVQNQDGSYSVKQIQRGQQNPGVAAAGTKSGSGGGLGSGGYPAPAPVTMPMGTQDQLASDLKTYQADKQQVPVLTTGTQSLNKALDALNAVATGAGTEGLAKMRSFAVSLGNILGVDTRGVNVQDMNRAELEKYLTDYARQSSTAGRSDESLNAAFHSNASGSINNAAAQDVVRTNIGRDRQTIAATLTQPNQQGAGYTAHKTEYATNTDPRGFAWDTYTEPQKQQILKDAAGSQGENSPAYQKLLRSIGEAQKLGLLNLNRTQPANVNTPSPPNNHLQAPPAPENGLQGIPF
jgi:hypothetical protein